MNPVQMTQLQTNCCTATGVNCDGNLRVTGINWYGSSLTGSINGSAIPSSVTWIDFGANQISGTIPTNLPVGLTSITLYWNVYLTGPLPRVLPSAIQWLDVSWNAINGTLPNVIPSSLTNLYLHANQMTGGIPQFPANMQGLWLNNNNFYGDISSLPASLTSLILGYTAGDNMANSKIQFTGSLTLNRPSAVRINLNYITNIRILDSSALTTCDLSQNPLLGNPNLANLGMCAQVGLYVPISVDCPNMINLGKGFNMSPAQMTQLQTNCCTASGVTCDGNLRVTEIDWYGFSLTGSINGSAIPSTVTSIEFGANRIAGTIPTNLPVGLTSLSLYWNVHLTGPLPSLLPPSIQMLDVSWNAINGTLPTVIPNSLSYLFVHENLLYGAIPQFSNNLRYLWMNANYFYGDISHLPQTLTNVYLGFTAGDNMANFQPQFTGTLTLNRPDTLRINLNYITNVVILDTSVLTTCELSQNPLLGNPNLVALTMCAQIGLYSAASLPFTGTTTYEISSSTIAVQTTTIAIKTTSFSNPAESTSTSTTLTSSVTSLVTSTSYKLQYTSESSRFTPIVEFEETTYFGEHPLPFLTIPSWFGTLKLLIDILLLYNILTWLYRRWMKRVARENKSNSSSVNSKQMNSNNSRSLGF